MTQMQDYVRCGGTGSLCELSHYYNGRMWRQRRNGKGKTITDGHIICPEELSEWLPLLVHVMIDYTCKRVKRTPIFVFLMGDTKTGNDIVGTAHPRDVCIVIVIKPRVFGWLKQSVPHRQISKSVGVLIEVIWHEIYHFKGHRGNEFITEGDANEILRQFWDYIYGEQ